MPDTDEPLATPQSTQDGILWLAAGVIGLFVVLALSWLVHVVWPVMASYF